ncbi:MAG: type II toxin-antitoxin system VapC family toxin [Acidimicrobiia bacterium]
MSVAFADTSALMKRYVEEPGSTPLTTTRTQLVVSALALVELPSALWRKHRCNELAAEHLSALLQEFDNDVAGEQITVVALEATVIRTAQSVLAHHALRSSDALQLASALVARTAAPECNTFLAFDQAVRAAAALERFVVGP